MALLSQPFNALIIGSSGTIGSAFMALLQSNPGCTSVIGLHRHSEIPIDYQQPESIEAAATALTSQGPFQLIINTIGVLHTADWMPEKRLEDINSDQLMDLMKINAIGPVLTIKHFSKLLDPQNSIMASLSAKVGSIEDNRLGGWYSYRASKAALNMLIKTAAIEFARTKPNTALVAIHPGTVNSRLSQPFRGEQIGRPPLDAASDMLRVIESLNKEDSGTFIAYSGERLPW
ncbi:SDR family NAD(P)-dependent oxidoreductase [Polynucleobacter sp. AP-Latsch-80-C2]|jgi:NAD(P)-dependent dehydrogenase (short-subunit alcohol dehydrogenase family)|uniref:SDR family NAD(P)-dependent oxidoreductase n=1 Tax=Polynucleobacter sp. AP-Latsch-80-C2 TaxID=2576931 RepID=UPI001C0E0E90|nr:SDR family NAD(P)-dependent oxidoreductase [Polynucleobacter sp. AP-Latsch-80-C2]MBU3624039.1 SDR family oxidoreductase [Polynucleobacter sp. AP-Latsch-80-C2]